LAAGQSAFLDDDYHIHFSDLLNRLRRIIDEVDGMNELMTSAIAANLALVQIRQNVDMRRISAWVGIGAVPTTIAGVYGMNFANMPELTWRYGYYVVITGLVAVSAGLFLLFRKYRWL
jgi:magnesium transporter